MTAFPNSQLLGKFCYFLKIDLTSFRNLSGHFFCRGCEGGAPFYWSDPPRRDPTPQRVRSTNSQVWHHSQSSSGWLVTYLSSSLMAKLKCLLSAQGGDPWSAQWGCGRGLSHFLFCPLLLHITELNLPMCLQPGHLQISLEC